MEIKVKTIENDEKFLRQKSIEIDFSDKTYFDEIKIVSEYCRNNEVLAMAAVQLGIPKRMIYIKNTDINNLSDNSRDESRILINPVIVSRKGKTEYWEACASCMDNTGLVVRPYEIVIKYKDINNTDCSEVFTGFEATVLSHEYDHLDGILHIDIAKDIKTMNKEERTVWRKLHGYKIIDKECEYIQAKINNNEKNYKKIANLEGFCNFFAYITIGGKICKT